MALPSFFRGDTVTYKVTVTDDQNAAVDLTSPLSILTLTFKADILDPDGSALIKIQDNRADPNADPANGIAIFNILSVSTTLGVSQDGSDIPTGSYFYDIQYSVSGAPATVKTVESGKVGVSQDITIGVP